MAKSKELKQIQTVASGAAVVALGVAFAPYLQKILQDLIAAVKG